MGKLFSFTIDMKERSYGNKLNDFLLANLISFAKIRKLFDVIDDEYTFGKVICPAKKVSLVYCALSDRFQSIIIFERCVT